MRLAFPERAHGVRAACWCVLAVVVALGLAWAVGLAGMLRSEAGRYDFSTYYAAALALRTNPHADIYAASVLTRAGAAGHVLVRPPLPFTYPPPLAIVLAPFTVLRFSLVSRAWLLGNAALELGIALLLARELWLLWQPGAYAADERFWPRGPRALAPAGLLPRLAAVAIALALLLPAAPAAQTLLTGQIDLLVLLPLVLIPELSRRGHERWVGGMVAAAALLKLTPVVLLLYLALRRRWEALSAAMAALALALLVCTALLGPGVMWAGAGVILGTSAHDATLGQNEALLASLPGAHTAAGLALAAAVRLALALGTGWLLWRGRPRAAYRASEWTAGDAATYAMALCLLLLVAPVAWVHHFVWVAPAETIALGLAGARALAAHDASAGLVRAPEAHRYHQRAGWALLASVALACLAIAWPLPHGWDTLSQPVTANFMGLPLRPLLLELRALGTLLVLALLALLALLASRTAAWRTRQLRDAAPPVPNLV